MGAKQPTLLALLPALLLAQLSAQVPAVMGYQGRLLAGASVFEGTGQFKFAFVNAAGTQSYWRNAPDTNGDGQPDASIAVPVAKGLYSVLLGDAALANMAPVPASVFTNNAVFLRVWFDDGTHGFEALSPDQRIAAVGYALVAATVPDASVTAAKLAPGALDAANLTGVLAPEQIPSLDASKLGSGVVHPSRLPANIAFKDTDLAAATNALGSQLAVADSQLAAQIINLSTELNSLSGRFEILSRQVGTNLFAAGPGSILSSATPLDPALIAGGYVQFTAVAAPGWATSVALNAPTARYGHSAVWTGQEWIVWGGNLSAALLSGTGARYLPATDQWLPITPADAPPPRSGHSAVWTGQEMILWGGYAGGTHLGDGARYNPANQAWTALPLSGAPSGREDHVAAWTGSRVLIWGGRNTGGLLGDGALYLPSADQWSALDLPGAPAARSRAGSVWTGSTLVVWGGEGVAGALGTGASLLFSANGAPFEWRAISMVNAPGARHGHSTVWTGHQVLIWGGTDAAGGLLASGAAYDPVTDSWEALPSADAASARSGHSAVWTGFEMLVFGGTTSAGESASSHAYDPARRRWRALSTAGDPVARRDATAVWTGKELVVYGGRTAEQAIGALQRLDPQPTWYFYRKP